MNRGGQLSTNRITAYLRADGNIKVTAPQEVKDAWFIREAEKVHGKLYRYPNAKYINKQELVEVECKERGRFTIRPSELLEGKGCKLCKKKVCKTKEASSRKIDQGCIYLWGFHNKNIYKIGRSTKRRVNKRIREVATIYNTKAVVLRIKPCDTCIPHERELKRLLKHKRVTGADLELLVGHTEMFRLTTKDLLLTKRYIDKIV